MLDHVMEFIEAMLCSHNDKPLRVRFCFRNVTIGYIFLQTSIRANFSALAQFQSQVISKPFLIRVHI